MLNKRFFLKWEEPEKIAPSTEYLPFKHGEESSIPRDHIKMPRVVADACGHCTERYRPEDPWKHAGQTVSMSVNSKSIIGPVSKEMGNVLEDDRHLNFCSALHTHISTCIHTPTCINCLSFHSLTFYFYQ